MIPPPPRSTLFPYTSSSDLSSSRLRQNAMRRTMRIPLYQVDAFAGRVFAGNPAAVCPLERWLDDATLEAIAAENNLSETAFFTRAGDGYDLRWFTPTQEIDLCGHATLASAFVVFHHLDRAAH